MKSIWRASVFHKLTDMFRNENWYLDRFHISNNNPKLNSHPQLLNLSIHQHISRVKRSSMKAVPISANHSDDIFASPPTEIIALLIIIIIMWPCYANAEGKK